VAYLLGVAERLTDRQRGHAKRVNLPMPSPEKYVDAGMCVSWRYAGTDLPPCQAANTRIEERLVDAPSGVR
jgi:hypothetical protein